MSQVISRREQQAAQTRLDILGAARRLFADQGYRSTRIADIAAAANVSPQTIYDAVGSKATIAASLVDGMEAEVGLQEMIPLMTEGDDPRAVLAAQLELTHRFVALIGDLLRALAESGEAELRAIRDEGRRRHRFGVGLTLGRIEELGALDDAVDVDRLADVVASLTDGDVVLTMVDSLGWNLDDAVAEIGRIVEREVFGD